MEETISEISPPDWVIVEKDEDTNYSFWKLKTNAMRWELNELKKRDCYCCPWCQQSICDPNSTQECVFGCQI